MNIPDLFQYRHKLPSSIFEKVLKNNLGITDEELLLIGDKGYSPDKFLAPLITNAFSQAAANLGINHSTVYQNTKVRGESADVIMLKQLKNLPPRSVIALNVSNRLGKMDYLGRSFRRYCKLKQHRFVSMASLGMIPTIKADYIANALDVDAKALQKKGERIKKLLDNASEVTVRTPAGTDLKIGLEGREAIVSAGLYREPGTGGNTIPAETYIAPARRAVNGTLVIDGSLRLTNKTQLIRKPVICKVEQGDIVSWNNTPESKLLQESITWAHSHSKFPWGVRRIGELGIGLNPSAKIIGATILDEKSAKSAHLAIGSNAWFGGDVYSIIHLDQVIKNPSFKIDNKWVEF